MKFYITNIKAKFKGVEEKYLKAGGKDGAFNLFEDKEYHVYVKCDSKRNFTNINFNVEWNDNNVVPIFNQNVLDYQVGKTFEGGSILIEKAKDENKIIVGIESKDANTVGTFNVVIFKFTVKQTGFDVYLYIEVQEII